MEHILTPPFALLIYIGLVMILYGLGSFLSPKTQQSAGKSSIYAGGEVANTAKTAPGYRRFFVIALFFAVLHLAALVLATAGLAGSMSLAMGFTTAILIYLGGIALILLILFLS